MTDIPEAMVENESFDEEHPVIKKYIELPQPKVTEPLTLLLILITGALGAIIGLELITRLGITANTSIIGALVAIGLGAIPVNLFSTYKNIYRQNLIQTSISAATFGAGNALLLSMGTVWLLGRQDVIVPMFIGALIGMIVDITMMYWAFDTPAFPASETWPPGIATAETLFAAAEGGKRALLLVVGAIIGAIGQSFKIPMDVFGVAWIGNVWALAMFGVGLILRGYSQQLFGVDINKLYVPHGIMIGAGVVALIQIYLIIKGKRLVKHSEKTEINTTRTSKDISFALRNGFILYIAGALLLGIIGKLTYEMSFIMLLVWVVYAAIAALVSELMVGISAMHAGWFPAFATALIFLVIGMLMGFPPLALALLVGYTACTGPAFADMGYDLKTGWLIRGKGKYREIEIEGRKQQFFAELIGAFIAIVIVAISYNNYFTKDLIPPVDRVFAATIQAGAQPGLLKTLILWAVVGGVIQFLGGAEKQIGILFATGLLIKNPNAGIAVLVALLIRVILLKTFGKKIESSLYVTAAGFIAGSTLYSFFTSTMSVFGKKK